MLSRQIQQDSARVEWQVSESTARTGWNDPESARAYDQLMVPAVGGPMARGLLRAVQPGRGPVLELASGTGFFSAWVLEALGPGRRVLGCDAGRAVLEVAAAKQLPGLTLVQADAHDLPVQDSTFTACYCNLGMQIFLKPDLVLREMVRALQPGAGLAYAIPGRGTLVEFWAAFAERASRPALVNLIDAEGRARINRWLQPDDAAEATEHLDRLQAAQLQDPQVVFNEETLIFRNAEDLFSRGGFGHYNQAVETISDESVRPVVLADVARLLNHRRTGDGLRVTVRALIASGRKREE
jgi:ubiquinone/menaquinone biosynthesis C-methylase UbiE